MKGMVTRIAMPMMFPIMTFALLLRKLSTWLFFSLSIRF
jgi:hypothetical protein